MRIREIMIYALGTRNLSCTMQFVNYFSTSSLNQNTQIIIERKPLNLKNVYDTDVIIKFRSFKPWGATSFA